MNINTGKALSKEDSLNQSVNLILLSPKCERVLNRNFGSNVVNYLGQPINNVAMEISAEVISSLQNNDARILVDSVSIKNNNSLSNRGLILEINYNASESTNVNLT
jgi:phage baseplate assembly protein W